MVEQLRPLGVSTRKSGVRHLGSQAMRISVEADHDIEGNARGHDLMEIAQPLRAEIADCLR